MERNQRVGLSLGLISWVVSGILISACGQKSSNEKTDDPATAVTGSGTSSTSSKISADRPEDSTGTSAALSLSFSSGAATSALALQTSATLDLGNGVVLSDARVNIGSIKLKAKKERSEAEREMMKLLNAEKAAAEKELESQKEDLEAQKEAIKQEYEPQFETAANQAAKEALKTAMASEIALVEKSLADLEAIKDQKMSALESQKDGNLKWEGPFVYNLIDGAVSPAVPEVQTLDGSYRRIEFKIKPNRSLDAEDPMLNSSVYLAGTVDVAGTPTPVTISLRIDEEFKLMGAGAFKVDANVSNSLTIAFNPQSWFTGVDFSGATLDSLGVIVVDESTNKTIWESIRSNIKQSTKFGEDKDHDGHIGDDESAGDGQEAETEVELESESEAESEVETQG